MALLSDYMFNSMSRIGNDVSDKSQKTIQNVSKFLKKKIISH